eukprot:509674-Rhodomonas_salina.1
MASRVGTPLPSRPTTSSSRATKPSRLSSAAPSSRRELLSDVRSCLTSCLGTRMQAGRWWHRRARSDAVRVRVRVRVR